MMTQIRPIVNEEKSAYLNSVIKQIDQFIEDLDTINELYESVNFDLPLSCSYNFRDALFHFLKMTKLDEENSISNEGYALQEHLHRSIKDAIINFLQQFVICVERLLFLPSLSEDEKLNGENNIKKYNLTSCSDLEKNFDSISDEAFLATAKSLYITKIKSKERDEILRNIIHDIKNYVLLKRSESMLIQQPYKYCEKVQEFFVLYNSIRNKLESNDLYDFVLLFYKY